MKTHLLYRDDDFDWDAAPPAHSVELVQDLELDTMFAAMAGQDDFLRSVVERVTLAGLTDPGAITYRQQTLSECVLRTPVVMELYQLATDTLAGERAIGAFSVVNWPAAILSRAVEALEFLLIALRRLLSIAQKHAAEFTSEAWSQFFAMVTCELDGSYFAEITEHLTNLRFRSGVLISAELGAANHGQHFVLHSAEPEPPHWWDRLATGRRNRRFSFTVIDRDADSRYLAELQGRGINVVANALAQSTDHILNFFRMMRLELGFYVGCAQLHHRLVDAGYPVCVPATATGPLAGPVGVDLRDVPLALRLADTVVVGNDITAGDKPMIVITGANQGGKSTLLRSLGVAQVMFQAGMFVAAKTYTSTTFVTVFTHFRREEDATMTSGKLDEELARMSTVVDGLGAGSLVMFNESFAATNEREGSEIARQIVHGLRDSHVAVWFVTHMFDFASSLQDAHADTDLFLRAERTADGGRTFRVVAGEPLPTSYGHDLYARIFGDRQPKDR